MPNVQGAKKFKPFYLNISRQYQLNEIKPVGRGCPKVATAAFIKEHAQPGTLATLTGLTGGAHAGFGKGLGGLAGGIIIEGTKNTKMAFYYFGIFSFACGGGTLAMLLLCKLCCRFARKEAPRQEEGEEDEGTAFETGDAEKEVDAAKEDKEELPSEMVVAVKLNSI